LISTASGPSQATPAVGVAFDLHAPWRRRAPAPPDLVDEQAGEFDRLGQRAAAVVAQVDHEAVDLVCLLQFGSASATSRVALR
jgi:hypothetical protein